MVKRLYYILLFYVISTTLFSSVLFASNKYAIIKLEGSVNPIISEHIVKSIEKAGREQVHFVVLQLDTPGGMMSSMREIIKSILSSEVPVVVYTYPKGAQAASAGGYIMLSAHIAAMAPGTEIGAMHPVSPFLNFGNKDKEGKNIDGIMEKKVLNDTIAYAKSLAQKRKRNEDWTEKAVRDAISSTYIEAERLGVIDFIAEDMNDLIKKLHNRKVEVNGDMVMLNTLHIGQISYEMDWKQRILNFFADPQVVFLLFIIAVIGIGMEIKSPGLILPGVIGAASFFIFLLAIRVLPINFAGLSLIALAILLFILELKITSYGLLTISGVISFIIGSMMLFDSPLPGGQIPLSSIIVMVIFLLCFFFIVVRSVIVVHKDKVTTGMQGMVGESGVAMMDFTGKGKIIVHGEIWNAKSDEDIRKDDSVLVKDIMGMTLIVEKEIGQ
ncbi:MAG: nodulation protein NfeD [Spirochaetota bacterium]|nr:nodulation protein NfeD [Spirochaetota bacterium]